MKKAKGAPQKIRLEVDIRTDCLQAKAESPYWKHKSEVDFLEYLITLGIERFKKEYLPLERADDISAQEKTTINE